MNTRLPICRIPLGAHLALHFHARDIALNDLQAVPASDHGEDQQSITDEQSLAATLTMASPENDRPADFPSMAEIAQCGYAEVEGQGRSMASVHANVRRGVDANQEVLLVLRFRLSNEQIEAAHAGAEFGFGVDLECLRVAHTLKRDQRAVLLSLLRSCKKS